jgi:hypothetical protein
MPRLLLIVGIIGLFLVGVFSGKEWARWTGIVISVAAIIWAVGWAEIQPIQSLISALIYVSVVFALATHPVTVERGS